MDQFTRIKLPPEMEIEAVGDEHRDSTAASAALHTQISNTPTMAPFVTPHDGKHAIAAAQALLRHLRGDATGGGESRAAIPWYRSAGAF